MPAISEIAPAKVNLSLEVLGRRPDGFHELASLVLFARNVADRISLDPDQPRGLTIAGEFAGGLLGCNAQGQANGNSVETCLGRLARAHPDLRLGHVRLEKLIPVASGLGGGSADAGAVLRAVKRANAGFTKAVDWSAFARALGADVPVCLRATAAFTQGKGDLVTSVSGLPDVNAVLVNTLQGVPENKTSQVFRRLNAAPFDPGRGRAVPSLAMTSLDEVITFVASHGNALQDAACALMPQVAATLDAVRATAGCRMAQMSGAGPTVLGLFPTPDAAKAAAAELKEKHPEWWVRATALA